MVAIADCPFDSGAAVRLRELEFLISRLIDEDYDFEAWPGIAHHKTCSPACTPTAARRAWSSPTATSATATSLSTKRATPLHRPGRGGKADRWLDIAFAHRNLREEISTPSPPASSITTTPPNANFRATR
jgi:kanamycin kinase